MRKGRRGRGAAGKVPIFGLLKRDGHVHAVMIPDAKAATLIGIIRKRIQPDSIVFTDSFSSYDTLDVSEFHHLRINHRRGFVEAPSTHINGIENFWNQAKRHLRRCNCIAKQHFHLYLKECEWRFNYRPARTARGSFFHAYSQASCGRPSPVPTIARRWRWLER